MNTSIHGMKRTDWCGELRAADAGREVVLNGWCDRTRDNGGVLFLLLRDRTGIVQCTFDKSVNKDLFDIAFGVRMEYVLAVRGVVAKRDERAINPKMPTGEIEITVTFSVFAVMAPASFTVMAPAGIMPSEMGSKMSRCAVISLATVVRSCNLLKYPTAAVTSTLSPTAKG